MVQLPTAVDRIEVRHRRFFVKRDDAIDPLLSGNKYRKLQALVETPADAYRGIVSYGGTQSNAMLSIAALCNSKGWAFHYSGRLLPERIRQQPQGNLKMALELGMQLHELEPTAYAAAVPLLRQQAEADGNLFLPQGGADPLAARGIRQLAIEIDDWQRAEGIKRLNVVTPSGTGTTAYYLAASLPGSEVWTAPVVGSRGYLAEQMQRLGALPANLRLIDTPERHRFASPYPELLALWQELKGAGIEFDLIYGARMWHVLLQYIDAIDGEILYVHSGGLIGNATMLERYRHKGL